MDRFLTKHTNHLKIAAAIGIAVILVFVAAFSRSAHAADQTASADSHIITLHDNGEDIGFITRKSTLREALVEQNVRIDANDRTEPGLDESLVASSYEVNVYRARTVIIRDGATELRVITAYRTGQQIAKQAGITLHDEDVVKLEASSDFITEGAAEIMTITRATPFTFVFYGKTEQAYTQAKTVGDMLVEKHIKMAANDVVEPGKSTPITAGMTVKLYRNGIQTVTQDEEVPFETEKIKDTNRPIGFKEVKTPGVNGKRTVTYEVNMQNGIEVSRKELNSVTTLQPVKQVETVGTRVANGSGLTKSKGVMVFTDSNGVTHRETYYDLPMGSVMRNCGMGGYYTVRDDGAKVDRDGYVIIAANLANYPRCSVVETSIGPGKVYDTGGFAAVHPHGFDLATDWTNYDGR